MPHFPKLLVRAGSGKLLLVVASTIILGSQARGTHAHI
jgi:hypothetical protein